MIGTMIPAVQFAGMLNPVSSLEGTGAFIGHIYPTTHFLHISRGVFSKGLRFADLPRPIVLCRCSAAIPVILGLSILLAEETGDLSMRHASRTSIVSASRNCGAWCAIRSCWCSSSTPSPDDLHRRHRHARQLHKAPIAIVDEDGSPLSARIVSSFYPPHFKMPSMVSLAEVDAGMDRGDYTFALDIPPNFQRDVLAGRSPAIQLNVDATRMSQAFTGNGYIQQIVAGEVNEFVQRYRSRTTAPPGGTRASARASTPISNSRGSAQSWRSSTTSPCSPSC